MPAAGGRGEAGTPTPNQALTIGGVSTWKGRRPKERVELLEGDAGESGQGQAVTLYGGTVVLVAPPSHRRRARYAHTRKARQATP
jgi:hypothetical protein